MKYATIDGSGILTGFYDDNINTVPGGAKQLTDPEYLDWLENQEERKWDVGGTETIINIAAPTPDVATYKITKKKEIDDVSERQRLVYITNGSGQAMVYQEKAEEAADYIAAGSPVDLTSYPFIQAEVNATSKTTTDAANDILTTQSTWITKGSQIEEYRIKAKIDIDGVSTIASIDIIVDAAIINIQGV